MRRFLVVRVDPDAPLWKNLRDGYRVLGELVVDDILNAVEDALPRDPGLTYVDYEDGTLRSWDGDRITTDGHLLAILGYPELTEAAKAQIVPLVFRRPTDPHTALVASNLFNEALGNDGRNDDYGLALKTMEIHGRYQMHRRDLYAVIRHAMRRANGSTVGASIGDLFPGLSL